MEDKAKFVMEWAASCSCEKHNPIQMETIVIESNAIDQIVPYIHKQQYQQMIIVADENTYRVAGQDLIEKLTAAGLQSKLCMVKPDPQGDVVADEATLIQVMLDVPNGASALVAVGSGTIHDIVRIIGYKMNKPFISVPTAPSVDGFTSLGAPVILRGVKVAIPASAPVALFADLNILIRAPRRLIAAGFGDMLGKYTSLFDWSFSSIAGGEPYCPAAAAITRKALIACVDNVEEIAACSEQGVHVLMNALVESGLAMLLFGQSHPASGAEHHLSHYWEMEYLKQGKKQLLHGAKVGVACAQIVDLYHRIGANMEISPSGHVQSHWEEIKSLIAQIPEAKRIQELLSLVGGPTTPEDLGVEPELLHRSLQEAHKVRNRFTLLKAYNENKL